MMDDSEARWVITSVGLLALCVMLHGALISKLRRDVDFVTVLAEKRMTDA